MVSFPLWRPLPLDVFHLLRDCCKVSFFLLFLPMSSFRCFSICLVGFALRSCCSLSFFFSLPLFLNSIALFYLHGLFNAATSVWSSMHFRDKLHKHWVLWATNHVLETTNFEKKCFAGSKFQKKKMRQTTPSKHRTRWARRVEMQALFGGLVLVRLLGM